MTKKINRIYILGGGSAGAMTAVTLKKYFPEKDIRIIESLNEPVIGVGESTIGQINQWMSMIGIKDEEWMKECDATYKLSIRFENFHKKSDGGFHYPFGKPNIPNTFLGQTDGLNNWTYKKILYPETPNSDYANCYYSNMALVNNNTLTKNENNQLPGFDFKKDVAYHFDAIKFGKWLKEKLFKKLGGRVMSDNITRIVQNEDGSIKHLETYAGNVWSADLYIDCTGFNSILLGRTLKVPFESYEDILPNNKAWAARIEYTDKEKQLKPYTNCTALDNGWVWNIPLWSRIGTGYVFSDRYISDYQAKQDFKHYLISNNICANPKEEEFKLLKMRVGIHKTLWEKNVCAIGLSAGFIEPLESNGLFTVHTFLLRLVKVLQRDNPSQYIKDHFNFDCRRIFREFAEFVASHYALTERDDSDYWKDRLNKKYEIKTRTDSVAGLNDYIQQKMIDHHYNQKYGWHCIANGMGWNPTDMPTLNYFNYWTDENDRKKFKQDVDNSIEFLEKRKTGWNLVAKSFNNYYDFLKKEIYDNKS